MIQWFATEWRVFFSVVYLLMFSNPSLASTTMPPVLDSFALMKTIFSLLFVLGLIVLVVWLLKHTMQGFAVQSNNIRVVDAIAIGAKERVVLIDIGDTRLVLGVAPGQITKLHEMPRPHSSPSESEETLESEKFVTKLKQMIYSKKEQA